jgi:hypothetical protein
MGVCVRAGPPWLSKVPATALTRTYGVFSQVNLTVGKWFNEMLLAKKRKNPEIARIDAFRKAFSGNFPQYSNVMHVYIQKQHSDDEALAALIPFVDPPICP